MLVPRPCGCEARIYPVKSDRVWMSEPSDPPGPFRAGRAAPSCSSPTRARVAVNRADLPYVPWIVSVVLMHRFDGHASESGDLGMSRFRIPELFLGALLAVAIFALGMAFQSSRDQPAKNPANTGTPRVEDPYKPEPFSLDWVTNDGAVFFTAVLTFIAAVQAGLFWWQLRIMKRSLIGTENAAEAARISACATERNTKASIALQLPILRVTPESLGHDHDPSGENCWVYIVSIANLGATKAFPKEILYGFFIGDTLPTGVNYEFCEPMPLNCILEPDRNSITQRLTMPKMLVPGQWTEICRGNRLWFYCAIRYDDFIGDIHSHGFCWRWANTGISMGWRTDATPAYNQKA